jgi:hypothetical protein
MAPLLTLYLSYAALAALALAMDRHHRQVFGAAPSPGRAAGLRVAGALLLVLAPVPWTAEAGAMGFVAWLFCALPCAGVALVLLLAWRPRAAAALGLVGLARPRPAA